MKRVFAVVTLAVIAVWGSAGAELPLGLPPIPWPEGQRPSEEKIALGDKLFHDTRFSTTGMVSCATCHMADRAFTDGPMSVSQGINALTGTRNAPTVVNSVYFETMFWDGRSPSLADQALHPFVNPVEMGLPDHEPILEIVRSDAEYTAAFASVFAKSGEQITMDEVTEAIAAFESIQVTGNSPFDQWYFQDAATLSEQQERGFNLFINEGRCVSCHRIEETQAVFTDNRFHNIGVGVNAIQDDIPELAGAFIAADATLEEVDIKVLTDARSSELGRFAVTHSFDGIGAFKTPTLRNIAATAPYMHDGSIQTLREVVVHYNNGGVTNEGDPVNDFLSGGIRPLNLSEEQIDELVAFMEALTSPEYQELADASASSGTSSSGTSGGGR
ncbi:cytochrome-c peroxidase [bacterium]|nr:MAG: cytochrome-c peroxidase [bacterium]RKZ16062.1 MAG: cytochrome-c peroxidase [bacterium]